MWWQLSASIEKVFHSLDADGNGFLDRDELKAGFASMVSIPLCGFLEPQTRSLPSCLGCPPWQTASDGVCYPGPVHG